jgi:hypothetical protein
MGKRSAGKKPRTARRTRALLELGILHPPRGTWCPRCKQRLIAVVSPTGNRFHVTTRHGHASCP